MKLGIPGHHVTVGEFVPMKRVNVLQSAHLMIALASVPVATENRDVKRVAVAKTATSLHRDALMSARREIRNVSNRADSVFAFLASRSVRLPQYRYRPNENTRAGVFRCPRFHQLFNNQMHIPLG